ncbi:MAG: ATP-binding protein, partial [Bacteroidota bacterium]
MPKLNENSHFIGRAVSWASNLGCNYTEDRVLQNQARLTNRLAGITAVSGLSIAAYLSFTPSPVLGVLYIAFISTLMVTPLILNSLGKLHSAKLAHILMANSIIVSLSLMFGQNSHFQYFLITMVGVPFVLFTNSRSNLKWVFSVFAVLNWVLVEVLFTYLDPVIYLNAEITELFRWLSNGLQFFFVAFMFYVFADESNRFVKDLTSQKEELRESYEQLDVALDRAKEATKTKAMFLANMSHEIRTPLNGIIVASELLKEGQLGGQEKGFSDIIHSSSKSLLSIVNDVLDLSKAEERKIELDIKPFFIHHLVREVMDAFWHQAKQKNILLLTDLQTNLHTKYKGDEQRIKQILNNLLGNAIKFCDSGYVMLKVNEVHASVNGEKMLQFSIEDSGIGIEKDKQEAIFESFTQADGSTSRTYGGTGLGTTISKMLVELMGGEIGVISPNP